MIAFTLSQIAQAAGGALHGADGTICAVSSDTRTLAPGQLFVALNGAHYDGHDYLAMATARGATAALVSRPVDSALPQIVVDDTRLALGRLAKAWRAAATTTVVAVTGSNGKTTLKEMIAAILGRRAPVLATRGNLNNEIGMPLTLLRLQDEPQAVIELGANHVGEIDYLSRIAAPDVAVLNNAGRAHLEGFGSLEGVARAKAEILHGLRAGGTFVYNADDQFAPLWRDLARGHASLGFGMADTAAVRGTSTGYRVEWDGADFAVHFGVHTPTADFEVGLALAGMHNRMNALAAIAAAHCLGVAVDDMVAGLAVVRPVAGRLCPVPGLGGMRLVDDSYNANPDSVLAALQVLAGAPGQRTLVLGDLAELGTQAPALMRELGERAAAMGIDHIYSVGRLSGVASAAFGHGARHFDDQTALIDHLRQQVDADSSVLVKGSRAAGMETVVQALRAEDPVC